MLEEYDDRHSHRGEEYDRECQGGTIKCQSNMMRIWKGMTVPLILSSYSSYNPFLFLRRFHHIPPKLFQHSPVTFIHSVTLIHQSLLCHKLVCNGRFSNSELLLLVQNSSYVAQILHDLSYEV